MSGVADTNRRLKRWPGWVLLGVLAAVLLAVGISRESGPQTQRERIDAIARRVACPTCDGESVFESRASSSENVRREIARLVAAAELTDDQIVAYIDDSYTEDLTLTPDATGLEGVAWALPVAVAVMAVAGLTVVFVRGRREAQMHASDEDRALVAAARHRSGAEPGAEPGAESGGEPGGEPEP